MPTAASAKARTLDQLLAHAHVHLARGRHERARRLLELALTPAGVPYAAYRGDPSLPDAYAAIARCHLQLQNTTEALRVLGVARRRFRGNVTILSLLARARLQVGNERAAGATARAALRLGKSAEASLVLAEIMCRQQKMEQALRHCNEALNEDTSRFDVYEILTDALQGLGLADEAAEIMRVGLPRIPRTERRNAMLLLARLARLARRWELAEKTLRQLLKSRDDREEIYMLLSEVCGHTRRHGEAIQYARKALELNPRNMEALHYIAASNLQLGAMAAAIRAAELAVEVAPSDPVTRFKLGVLLHQHGNISGALEQYSLIVSLNADSMVAESAQEAITNIEQYQFQQILMRCSEDTLFRMKLRQDVERTLAEYGYAPSLGLVATIRSSEVDQLLGLPTGDKPSRVH